VNSFLAIDFETADNGADSACAIGMVRVENNNIVKTDVKLIRPPRERMMFTHIHGLSWNDVKNSPSFGDLWPEIAPLFDGVDFLVAHNAPFDRRVLQACWQAYGISPLALPFKCTVNIARNVLQIKPANLANVCQTLDIELNHHEALSDALACAKIYLHANNVVGTAG